MRQRLEIRLGRKKRREVVISSLVVLGIFVGSTFSMNVFAGSLGSVQFSPSTDLVNSISLYTIRFTTATTATINTILITFPAGFNIALAILVTESGLPSATKITITGQVINYSFTAKSISSKTNVFFIFQGIKNPSASGSFSSTATVQTKNGATLVDSGSSVAFSVRQLTTGDISTSSSLTIAALSTGTLTVTGAATFKSSVTTTGLLTASGGISTTNVAASGTLSVTGLLTANGGIPVPTGKSVSLAGTSSLIVGAGTSEILTIQGIEISESFDQFILASSSSLLYVGDGPSVPLALYNSTPSLLAYWDNHGNLHEEYGLTAQSVSATGAISGASLNVGAGSISGGAISFTGSLSSSSGEFFVTSAGNLLIGFGSSPLGGAIEADTSGNFYINNKLHIDSSGNIFSNGGLAFAYNGGAIAQFQVSGTTGAVTSSGTITAANFFTAGTLCVASCTFDVNGVGQVTTASINFASLDKNALPSFDSDCNPGYQEGLAWPTCETVTSPSFTAPAKAVAIVTVTVTFLPITTQPDNYIVDLFHTTYPGAVVVGGDSYYISVMGGPLISEGPAYFLPTDNSWTTVTVVWEVFNIGAGTSGIFNSTLVGNGGNTNNWEPTNVNIIDHQVTYLMIPALS